MSQASAAWDGRSGHLLPEDIALIGKLVAMLPPTDYVYVVDLGAGSGTAALAVCQGRTYRLVLVSVDILPEAIEATRAKVEQYYKAAHWEGLVDRSDRAAERYWRLARQRPVDLLLCDSSHDYASQADELEAWFPKLRLGALVWVHDYPAYRGSIYAGVKQAVDEAVEAGRLEEIDAAGCSWAGRFLR